MRNNRRSLTAFGMTTVFGGSGRIAGYSEGTRAKFNWALATSGQTNLEHRPRPRLPSGCQSEDPERDEGDEGSAVAFQESIRSSARR
jgi:hypothetical protein